MDDIETLVDDLLVRCVPGYQKPERKPKRKPVAVRDGFEQAPVSDHTNSPR